MTMKLILKLNFKKKIEEFIQSFQGIWVEVSLDYPWSPLPKSVESLLTFVELLSILVELLSIIPRSVLST